MNSLSRFRVFAKSRDELCVCVVWLSSFCDFLSPFCVVFFPPCFVTFFFKVLVRPFLVTAVAENAAQKEVENNLSFGNWKQNTFAHGLLMGRMLYCRVTFLSCFVSPPVFFLSSLARTFPHFCREQ